MKRKQELLGRVRDAIVAGMAHKCDGDCIECDPAGHERRVNSIAEILEKRACRVEIKNDPESCIVDLLVDLAHWLHAEHGGQDANDLVVRLAGCFETASNHIHAEIDGTVE